MRNGEGHKIGEKREESPLTKGTMKGVGRPSSGNRFFYHSRDIYHAGGGDITCCVKKNTRGRFNP